MFYVRIYSVPALLALLLHALLAFGLYRGFGLVGDEHAKLVLEPRALSASLMFFEPIVVTPTLPPSLSSTVEVEQQSSVAPQAAVDAESQEDDNARLREARERLLAQMREQTISSSVRRELDQRQQEALDDENQIFFAAIYSSIVQNWTRPLSARNNMTAVLQVELFPNGDLNTVVVLESSGNAAFDRSAESAVRKAAPFVLPDDIATFNEKFRRMTFTFRPEDLLR